MRFTLLFCLLSNLLIGQDTILVDFETFGLAQDSFLNGEDGSQGFTQEDIFFSNVYDDAFGSWSGWAISSFTDTTTPGFSNQYSSIAGQGVDGSTSYATTFVLGTTDIKLNASPQKASGLYVTNNTYTYLSMLEGDAFAKKFGGESGDDPDFFLLTIKKYLNGEISEDSIDFFLADYRFTDNSSDYIVDEWSWIDLESFAEFDSLSFSLSSSDVGAFGMNTPAYFCIDNFSYLKVVSSESSVNKNAIKIYPNPSTDFISVEGFEENSKISLYDSYGKLITQKDTKAKIHQINISHLSKGVYFIEVLSQFDQKSVRRILIN